MIYTKAHLEIIKEAKALLNNIREEERENGMVWNTELNEILYQLIKFEWRIKNNLNAK